jgi:hypothetical protein
VLEDIKVMEARKNVNIKGNLKVEFVENLKSNEI